MKSEEIVNLPIEKIKPGPFQIREVLEDEELKELATSINVKGVIQPIIVNPDYEIITGNRRAKASRLAGKTTIPAIVKDVPPDEALAWSVVENTHRKDPTLIEEARAFQKLAESFGGNPNPVAEMISKSVTYVNERLLVLKMPEEVQKVSQELGISRIKELAKITNQQDQIEMAKRTLVENFSALEIAAYSQAMKKEKTRTPLIGPEEIVRKANRFVLRLFVELKHLNEQAEETFVAAIREDKYFLKNIGMLTGQIERLSKKVAK